MERYRFLETFLFPPVYLNRNKLSRELSGKTVLITGASSGIGEALAYLLSPIDVHMILVARNEEKLQAMKKDIQIAGAKASVFRADLRNTQEMQALLDFIHELPHGLDVVVSNAGKSICRPITESLDRFHDFTRTIAINYFAPVQLLLSTIPLLKNKGGQVINVSTVNALLSPIPYWAAYQASKTAFDTWFRSVAPELNAMGICTTTLYLPLVRTPMIKPTAAYRNMPAMSAVHVAKIISRSMYMKNRKFKPWWVLFGEIASFFFKGIWEICMRQKVKKKIGKG